MRAVVLAAGEGIRMRPLTLETPKPMLKLLGKPLLEHLLAVLPEEIEEIIIVHGYLGRKIQEYFGDKYGRFGFEYVEQRENKGTFEALTLCDSLLKGERFLSLYADDLHAREDLKQLLEYPLSVLVKEVEHPERFGVATLGEDGSIQEIIEKPLRPRSNFVLTGPAVLDYSIFSYHPKVHESGERYLADAIGELAKKSPVKAVEASFWFPIGYPEDLKHAEILLSSRNVKDA